MIFFNRASPYRRDDRQGSQGHIGVRTLLVDETRERGLMNPATKKYPRPNLPLLCKRFKRRDERHIIKTWCRLKDYWLRRPSTDCGEPWGELTVFSLFLYLGYAKSLPLASPLLAPPPKGRLLSDNKKSSVIFLQSSDSSLLFFALEVSNPNVQPCHKTSTPSLPLSGANKPPTHHTRNHTENDTPKE